MQHEHSSVFPSIFSIIHWADEHSSYILSNVLFTSKVAFCGGLVAIVIAVSLSSTCSLFPRVLLLVKGLSVVTQTLPIIAVAPILIVIFGQGFLIQVLISALIAFFPLLFTTSNAVSLKYNQTSELVRALALSSKKKFRYITIPGVQLGVAEGITTTATLCIVGAIIGEFVSPNESGIGAAMLRAMKAYNFEALFAWFLAAMFIGLLAYLISFFISKYLLYLVYTKCE
ncbi:NitT/TauT family transport system permease protein [Nitrosomonas marina]|uniref:NitT/TauT family transport system permease protein n=1 Tax=Nitrosomonas marina TaxID=917 RepID=A0A1I0FUK0_9PROT|nr:ABC transporter permease subunit [Nitrosomonas marina]SET61917.1 NitT/TauT family transport system permease protein [Nitrosomonas marina]